MVAKKSTRMNYIERRYENGEIYIHRTWAKMLLNPILSLVNWQLVSCFKNNKFVEYNLKRHVACHKLVRGNYES